MNADVADRLSRVAAGVFEDAAFVFTEPAAEPPAWSGTLTCAELAFEGPRTGSVSLAASDVFCAELAANVLGLEPGDPAAATKGAGALGEILNMLTGVLMAELFGTQAVCHLGIPQWRSALPPDQAPAPADGAVRVTLMDDSERRIDIALALSM